MTRKKFEIIQGQTNGSGQNLYRIRALIDIPRHTVYAGEYGGWVESESNLSHDGDAWIGGQAVVTGRSKVYGHAIVKDNARVSGESEIYERAIVAVESHVVDSIITDDVKITAHAYVNKCHLESNLVVRGNVRLTDCSIFGQDSYILDNAVLKETRMTIVNSAIQDDCRITDCSLGSTLYPLERLLVSKRAQFEKVRNILPVSTLVATDDTRMYKVLISGKSLTLNGMASITGNIKVENSSLEDIAGISLEKEELKLKDVELWGDFQITDENAKEFSV